MKKKDKIKRALASVCAGVTITHRLEGADFGGHGFDHRRSVVEITGAKFPMHNPSGKVDGWINRYEIVGGLIKFEAAIEDTDRARKIMGLGALIGPAPRAKTRARRAQTRRRG